MFENAKTDLIIKSFSNLFAAIFAKYKPYLPYLQISIDIPDAGNFNCFEIIST